MNFNYFISKLNQPQTKGKKKYKKDKKKTKKKLGEKKIEFSQTKEFIRKLDNQN